MSTLPPTPPPRGAGLADLVSRHVSIIVGSRDRALRPHLMRAVGCRLSPDGQRVTLLLPQGRSAEVLADLRDNGHIAVVFSEPSSNLTIQVKGHDASVTPCGPDDAALAEAYLQGFIEEIGQLGHTADVAHTILGQDTGLVAVHFAIAAAFDQTPGPAAGKPLGQPAGVHCP